jgi:peptidyl-prolyl cis-trans isomerase C
MSAPKSLRALLRLRGRRGLRFALLASLCLGLSGHAVAQNLESAQGPHGPHDRIVAEIDDDFITSTELESFTAQYLRQKLYHGGTEEELAALRREALSELIQRRLLLKEAKRRGIGGDFGAVEAEVAKLEARYGGSETWEQIEPRLPELRSKLLDNSRLEALEAEVRRVPAPEEDVLRAYYKNNQNLFTTPRANRLATILISVHPGSPKEDWVAAESEAKSLRARALDGADFAELAREFSDHDSAERGGDIGFLHEGELAPAIQVAVDKLEPGEMTEALHVLEGYVVFRLQERRAAELQPFVKVRDRAAGLYVREMGNRRWKDLLKKLENDAQIVFNQQKAEAGRTLP